MFAGAGGGLLASKLLGWNTVAACEIEKSRRRILLQRQRDGILDRFPIWDDVRTFDGRPWRGLVDIITGGFPCQDVSIAGTGKGLAGSRSSLWFEYERIIEEVRPSFIFAENSPNLRTRGLTRIVKGLDRLGYDCRWGVLGGWHFGASHKRNRMWVLAYDHSSGRQKQWRSKPDEEEYKAFECGCGWPREPVLERVAYRVANRVDRLEAVGDGQIPIVAATAFKLLSEGLL
ncbi:DNA cytosine methyltransferase [Thalassoglobus polymorphus]|uniref:DNA cytosine methyltransferase n=1 Tax=Thalassoglobus polymorphus TaxID=2527994 RepID=UPI0011A17224